MHFTSLVNWVTTQFTRQFSIIVLSFISIVTLTEVLLTNT
jgi:hypothetical protein